MSKPRKTKPQKYYIWYILGVIYIRISECGRYRPLGGGEWFQGGGDEQFGSSEIIKTGEGGSRWAESSGKF